MDRRLRELERAALAHPEDPGAAAALRSALARVADLSDREAWSRADPGAQDQVLESLGALLEGCRSLGAETYAVAGVAHRIGRFHHEASGVQLHLIPGGRARLGPGRDGRNLEAHREVTLPPLLVGRFPVRQAEWDLRPGEDERSFVGAELPIEGVTWHAARAWLTAVGLRLLSEAEWEYACRAGTTSDYFWGPTPDPTYAWYGEGSACTTHSTRLHAEACNAFGLVDVCGNVAEWCEDVYGPYGAHMPRDGSPVQARGGMRVIRGGDSFHSPHHCRSSARNGADARDSGAMIGFRAARSVPLFGGPWGRLQP
ncbi:MAG: formylglycine-generating enzyme family protein [Planctomycetota bacterium]